MECPEIDIGFKELFWKCPKSHIAFVALFRNALKAI
jgi:hypothetical protein